MVKLFFLGLLFILFPLAQVWSASETDAETFMDDSLPTDDTAEAEELDIPEEESDFSDTADDPSEVPADTEDTSSEDAKNTKSEDTPRATETYVLSFSIEGDLALAPKMEALAGGLEELTVAYRLTLETDVSNISQKGSVQSTAKLESAVSGYLFNSNNIACELHIDIDNPDTEISLSPKITDAGSELHIKIKWPDKIEEKWESYCLVSTENPFVTRGETETFFDTLLSHADPTLSSFVIPEGRNGFRQEFTIEFYDGDNDPVYEESGSGSGTFSLTPKPTS